MESGALRVDNFTSAESGTWPPTAVAEGR